MKNLNKYPKIIRDKYKKTVRNKAIENEVEISFTSGHLFIFINN